MITEQEIERLEKEMSQDRKILARGGQVGPRIIGEMLSTKLQIPRPTFERNGIRLEIIPEQLTNLDDLGALTRKFRVERTGIDGTQIRTFSSEPPLWITRDDIWKQRDLRNHKEMEKLDPWKLDDRKYLKSLGLRY